MYVYLSFFYSCQDDYEEDLIVCKVLFQMQMIRNRPYHRRCSYSTADHRCDRASEGFYFVLSVIDLLESNCLVPPDEWRREQREARGAQQKQFAEFDYSYQSNVNYRDERGVSLCTFPETYHNGGVHVFRLYLKENLNQAHYELYHLTLKLTDYQ